MAVGRAPDADSAGESGASSAEEDAFTVSRAVQTSGRARSAAENAASTANTTPIGGGAGADDDVTSTVSFSGGTKASST